MEAIDAATGLPAALQLVNGTLQIGGNSALSVATITRPADTTAYAANDAVSNSTSAPVRLSFTGLARVNAGAAVIQKARIMTDQVGCVAAFRLHLFSVAPTAINDNAPQTELWANRVGNLGFIDFPAMSTSGSGSDAAISQNATSNLLVRAAAALTTVYGLLETLSVFTPASGQNFYIELTANNA